MYSMSIIIVCKIIVIIVLRLQSLWDKRKFFLLVYLSAHLPHLLSKCLQFFSSLNHVLHSYFNWHFCYSKREMHFLSLLFTIIIHYPFGFLKKKSTTIRNKPKTQKYRSVSLTLKEFSNNISIFFSLETFLKNIIEGLSKFNEEWFSGL